jgi:SAM-dependent methyltransferase
MTSPEATTLYNAYLSRFLEHEGIDPAAFRFDESREKLGCVGVKTPVVQLFSGNASRAYYGIIVIRGEPGPSRNPPAATAPAEKPSDGFAERRTFHSSFFEVPIELLPGVFPPMEAEGRVLPFMQENAERFRDASVLDIGTGSGMIGLYAATLGARKVVVTDINETAVRNAGLNAENLGVASVVEARLEPLDDMSAYSVIGPDERFDVVISNPPYSLDLDAPGNTAETDQGDLGFSIVRGLDRHLNPKGVAVLLYPSIFYHHVMVKYARFDGFDVRDHAPLMMTPLEGAALFNTYLSGFLSRAGLEPDAFGFDQAREPHMLGCFGYKGEPEPLLPGGSSRLYAGMIVIRRGPETAGSRASPGGR